MNTLALIPGMQGVPEVLLIVFVVLLLFVLAHVFV